MAPEWLIDVREDDSKTFFSIVTAVGLSEERENEAPTPAPCSVNANRVHTRGFVEDASPPQIRRPEKKSRRLSLAIR